MAATCMTRKIRQFTQLLGIVLLCSIKKLQTRHVVNMSVLRCVDNVESVIVSV